MAELELERGEKLEAARLFARRAALVSEPRARARSCSSAPSALARAPAARRRSSPRPWSATPPSLPRACAAASCGCEADPRAALDDLEAVLALPATDADALREDELLELTRRASSAAVRAGRADAARRLLAQYCTLAPEDLEAQVELAGLHRKAGAREPLADLLTSLWPHLSGDARRSARRELTELSLTLGRSAEAADALRSLLAEEPHDTWATQSLLELLPPPGTGTPQEEAERLSLLGTLITASEGDARAELLARRAALHRNAGRSQSAREDFLAATKPRRRPAPLLLAVAALAREAGDDAGELAAWSRVVVSEPASPSAPAPASSRSPPRWWRRTRAPRPARPCSPPWRCRCPRPSAVMRWFALATLAAPRRADGRRGGGARRGRPSGPRAPPRGGPAGAREPAREERETCRRPRSSLESALSLAPRHAGATARAPARAAGAGGLVAPRGPARLRGPHAPPAEAAALYAELGTLHLERLAQPDAAEAALRQAVRLAPENVDVRRRLVALVAGRGDSAEAAKLLDVDTRGIPPAEAASLLREGAVHARARETWPGRSSWPAVHTPSCPRATRSSPSWPSSSSCTGM